MMDLHALAELVGAVGGLVGVVVGALHVNEKRKARKIPPRPAQGWTPETLEKAMDGDK